MVGMQGNQQQGNTCLEIVNIPERPYYPQSVTISYWNVDIDRNISLDILIKDCNGDKPTCEEYYAIQGLIGTSLNTQSNIKATKNLLSEVPEYNIIIYDISGNKLGNSIEEIRDMNYSPQIIIITYWNNNGDFIKAEKGLLP